MYKNVCIILLIFLIVYLIYKISSNSCDCFSVSSQCRNRVDSCVGIGTNSNKCNKSWTKMYIGGANKKMFNEFYWFMYNGYRSM